jgi:hypothetical protein
MRSLLPGFLKAFVRWIPRAHSGATTARREDLIEYLRQTQVRNLYPLRRRPST